MQTMFSLVFHMHCSSVDVVVITEISFFSANSWNFFDTADHLTFCNTMHWNLFFFRVVSETLNSAVHVC